MLENKTNETKYIQIYAYYKDLILKGTLESGVKMPSIRKCCDTFSVSKTTVETAYIQLSAEGYIISKPQSGFYVCTLENDESQILNKRNDTKNQEVENLKYNLISSAGDKESFNFALWRRYVKSAFRQEDRLLSYGDVQGELDLRQAICNYVNVSRNVICTPAQIVVGAGTQSLLQILCAINSDEKTVGFFGEIFKQGRAVFEDYEYKITKFDTSKTGLDHLKEQKTKLIYVSPSHMNNFGEVLPISQRMKILNFAKKNNCLVIEDDYGSEFRNLSKPVPSMQGIDSGENVVYLGTFSSLLIPSIRISFMVLPTALQEKYETRKHLYNQTASKIEQIALCQFVRDGHLNAQIKKQRIHYIEKAKMIVKRSKKVFDSSVQFSLCQAGYLIKIEIFSGGTASKLALKAKKSGIALTAVQTEDTKNAVLVISSAGIAKSEIQNVMQALKNVFYNDENIEN